MNYYLESMFKSNGFDILVKENKLRSKYLSDENRSMLKKLIKRLCYSNLSAFDIQISQKDFIGMALEAEQRGETLSSVIGNDMNLFCDEVIKNGRKRGWKEYVTLSIPLLLLAVTFAYANNYILFNSCPPIMKITLQDGFHYLFWSFLIAVPLINYLYGKFIFGGNFKQAISLLIWPLCFSLYYVLLSFLSSKQVILFEVIGWVPLVIMSILSIVAYLLRNKYLSRLASGYNWRD